MAPTTTDRDHPPTPSDVDFQLDCYVTGIDPARFLDSNDTAMEKLQNTLAIYANIYSSEHALPIWRQVQSVFPISIHNPCSQYSQSAYTTRAVSIPNQHT